MRNVVILALFGLCVNLLAWIGLAWDASTDHSTQILLNVSYDPTRELWRELNAAFRSSYEATTGTRLAVRQSHGGSGSQARAVIDGLPADVVTLALWSDTDALRSKGLIAQDWESRLPNQSLPYYSTIVFVVRRGNPKAIHDWPDLVRDGVQVITPNPKTSGNGKLSFLGAWGAVRQQGGSEAAARAYLAELYRHVPVLDTGARGSTTTFAQNRIGDVHLTWENEAHLEVRESGGVLEIVYPPASIRAEPYVAVVDKNVDSRGTRSAAEAYLRFLWTEPAQEIIARHHHRPVNASVAERYRPQLPAMELFPITAVAKSWADAQKRFFAEGGEFDKLYQSGGSR
ncbi:MAG: sulfate ABC transporter substrate-binding protein [Gemmataceae bacterium]